MKKLKILGVSFSDTLLCQLSLFYLFSNIFLLQASNNTSPEISRSPKNAPSPQPNAQAYSYYRSTFSPQELIFLPNYFVPAHLTWNENFYYGGYYSHATDQFYPTVADQLAYDLSNLNFSTTSSGLDGDYASTTEESPLSSTSSLSTSYSSQYSVADDHLTSTAQNFNHETNVLIETRRRCAELFLVPESRILKKCNGQGKALCYPYQRDFCATIRVDSQ